MPDPPPRAPTFPAFIDQVKEVDDSDFVHSSLKPPVLVNMEDHSHSSSVPDTVPVVPLPVAPSKSRIRAVFLWRDPKLSAVVFCADMLFFYLTLIRGLSVLSVIGALFGLYVILRFVLHNINSKVGGKLDKYIARQPEGTPLFKRESFMRIADTIVEEGNENAVLLTDIIHCDNNSVTLACIAAAFFVYVLGMYCSLLSVIFVLTILAFSLPLAYEKNKKKVDDAVAKATDMASRHLETGRRAATERAVQLRDVAAERSAPLLEKAPPAARQFAERIGLTPKKSKPE